MKKLLNTLLFVCSVLILSSSSALAEKPSTLFQVATYASLQKGIYDSDYTYRKLMKQGDFGVGTFANLDGDMVALDGRFYQIMSSGKKIGALKRVDPTLTAPFAQVIFFHPFRESNIDNAYNLSKLEEMIVERLPNTNIPYAIEIDGSFRSLTISTLRKQERPFRPFKIAAKQQAVRRIKQTSGTLVGFWFPKYWGGIASPGLYLNFISATHTIGGHVLSVTVAHGALKSEPISNVKISLPSIIATVTPNEDS